MAAPWLGHARTKGGACMLLQLFLAATAATQRPQLLTNQLVLIPSAEPPRHGNRPVITRDWAASKTDDDTLLRGWGVTDHSHMSFHAQPEEISQMASAFRVIRTDFRWNLVSSSKSPQRYNFSSYETLLEKLHAAGSRPLWIIDRPPSTVQGGPPTTPASISAFAAFAVAAMQRFRGRGVIWELWK
jgi:hypothetical protein